MIDYEKADEELLRELGLAVLQDSPPEVVEDLCRKIRESCEFNPHTPQQIVVDAQGVRRFRKNELVQWLVDQIPGTLNTIACQAASNEDRSQLAQLIGYSVSGYHSLSYALPVEDEEG